MARGRTKKRRSDGGSAGVAPRTGSRSDWFRGLPLLFAALVLVVQFSHMMVEIQTVDEGVAASSAWRMLRGEVPYRDFFAVETPLSFYPTVAAFKVAGVSLAVERSVGMVWGVLLVWGVWALSRRLVSDPLYAAIPVAFLCQAGVGIWPFPSHHWAAAVFTLAALLAGLRAGERGEPRWSFLAGVCASLTAWSLQDQGAFLYLGAAAFHLPWLEKGTRLRATAAWLGGALAGGLPLLILMAVQGALADLWYDLVVFPLTVYRKHEGNSPGLFFPLYEIALQWLSGAWRATPLYSAAASLTSLSIYLSAVLAPWVLLLGWWKRWDHPWRRGLLAAGVLACLFPAYRRWAPINLMWATALPSIACAWGLAQWARNREGTRRRIPAALAWALLACFAFIGVYRTGRALPWSHMPSVPSPAGTLYAHNPNKAAQLRELVEAVEAHVPAGESLFSQEHGLIHFLTLRPNPTRYDFFVPPVYSTPEQVAEVIRDLEASGARFVVRPFRPPDPENPFDVYLVERFEPVWQNGSNMLLRRAESPPRPPAP